MLLTLAAIWGASFMFIEVALRDLAPVTLMAARVALAAAVLLAVQFLRDGYRETVAALSKVGVGGFAVGVVNMAAPFTLIAWGQEHIDSGTAAIGNASSPIWVALLAIWFSQSERAVGARLVGIALGLLGVGVLAGAQPEASWWALAGTIAVVAAAFLYAGGALIVQARMSDVPPLVISTATSIGSTIVLVPFALLQLPDQAPGAKAVGSIVALAVGGTAFGLILYFRMITDYGSARALLVTYLLPVTALFYGAVLLGESLSFAKIGGLVLILGGVAMGSGLVRPARRAIAEPAPP
jgi:drug/metabolite transporter (DMT)-like permease